MSGLLELHGACKTFRSGFGRRRRVVAALNDVSLAVGEGEITALVGESGSGKSTLGRVVVGLERLDGGEVVFAGTDYAHMSERELRRLRRQMHLVLQDPYQSLHPGMRIRAAVAEPLEIAGVRHGRAARVAEALEEVGLEPAGDFLDRFPHELSGGQRQRVVLARALVGRPRLVVADEPTSMVDATLRAGIVALIRQLRNRHGISFLVITHDLDMAGAVAEQVAVMRRGRLSSAAERQRCFTIPRIRTRGSCWRRRQRSGVSSPPAPAAVRRRVPREPRRSRRDRGARISPCQPERDRSREER